MCYSFTEEASAITASTDKILRTHARNLQDMLIKYPPLPLPLLPDEEREEEEEGRGRRRGRGDFISMAWELMLPASWQGAGREHHV